MAPQHNTQTGLTSWQIQSPLLQNEVERCVSVTANCIGTYVGLQVYTLYTCWPTGLYTVHMLAYRPIRCTHVGLQAYTLYTCWLTGLYTVHMLAYRTIHCKHVGLQDYTL